ncbi:MAG: DNA polymerase III subunit beta [Prevotellaceae bacterium]|jgi:DNA polymerase-3 subunit beta|nr:DNA polymerase III subunit beta [Prevotellaceae bacterium]
MKFNVSSAELLSRLQAISRVINSKTPLPILENFLFQLEENKLTLTASDLETTLVTSLPLSETQGTGAVAISAKLLLDTLKEFSDQPLTFDINDENLAIVITSENGKYNAIGQSSDEFPKLPEMAAEAKALTMSVDSLATGINRTLFATADDELRPVMNGILFDIKTDALTLVASDAHKLVRFKTTEGKASEDASFILPKKPATLLKNILPKESGEVSVRFDEKNICFTLSNYLMFCRQVEGRYPNYNSVIPQNNPNKAIIDRQTFINTLRRISVFANQASSLVKLQFSATELQISAQDIDFSISAEEKLACQYSGAPISLGFKATFLIDILANIISGEVIMEMSEPMRAGLILPFENEENEEVLMLLMPMVLND